MLTDIFARRYANYSIWTQYTENERRLLMQCIGVTKDVLPYYDNAGSVNAVQKAKWNSIHDRLARELGLRELWQRHFTYKWQDRDCTGTNEWVTMCEYFVTSRPLQQDADQYMKEALSLIELVMRERQNEIDEMNRTLERRVNDQVSKALQWASRIGGTASRDYEAEMRAMNAGLNAEFNNSANELNVRFQQAGAPLRYHNGFIQVAKDERIEMHIAKPLWDAIADPKWANVATDMSEALDRRDSGAGDAAWYACKALESAIKIISDEKGWTTGKEKGAHNYIDNLVKERSGARFIETFEMEILKLYFSSIRNPLGHGPGPQPMPKFTPEQTDWAIEFAMSWVRTLVRRL